MRARDFTASLTLHQLQIFLVVARSESLADAATELGLSPGTLSEHVKTLERVLGVRLFERSPGRRGFALTVAGAIWSKAASGALSALTDAYTRTSGGDTPDAALLKLGCGAGFASKVLPGVYTAFQERWPQIEVQPRLDNRPGLLEELRRERLDLAVVLGRPNDASIAASPLGIGMDVAIIARSDHPWNNGRLVPFAYLDEQTFVLPTKSTMHRELFDRLLTEAGIQVAIRWELDNAEALLRAVLSGMGITAVGLEQAASFIAEGKLAVLNVDGFPLHSDWFVCWRTTDKRRAVGLLREFLVERCASMP